MDVVKPQIWVLEESISKEKITSECTVPKNQSIYEAFQQIVIVRNPGLFD